MCNGVRPATKTKLKKHFYLFSLKSMCICEAVQYTASYFCPQYCQTISHKVPDVPDFVTISEVYHNIE